MPNTLLLDLTTWDLVVDVNGNIAMATEPYSLAQDASSAIRLFQGELWYDTSQGIPYTQNILGKMPPLQLLKTAFVNAAKSVPGVSSAVCYIASFNPNTRGLAGQVQITSTDAAGSGAAVIAISNFTSDFSRDFH